MDRYLAGGWFRSCSIFYRAKLLCMNEAVYAIVNLRLPLAGYSPPKRLQKLNRRNDKRFHVEAGRLQITPRKEELYQLQKPRFQGFTSPSLSDFFFLNGENKDIFQTYEIRVYDPQAGGQLVAVSFFDLGQQSIASLLGLYDPAYKAHSLGIYTMLKEIAYGQNRWMQFYYPGYTLDMPSSFDYKLRLKDLQFFSRSGRWIPLDRLPQEKTYGQEIRQSIALLCTKLEEQGLTYQRKIYPAFALAYWEQLAYEEFLSSPLFVILRESNDRLLIAFYHLDYQSYELAWVRIAYEYNLSEMNPSPEYLSSAVYFNQALRLDHVILRTPHWPLLMRAIHEHI
ncbi:MAG: hypothetical protein ACFCUI_02435 [Bernardetiaceae bacterium]